MSTFFYLDGQDQKGPVSVEELKALPIKKETFIWSEGMPEWKTAGEVEALSDFFKAMPPPFPSTPKAPIEVIAPPSIPNVANTSSQTSAKSTGKSGTLKMGLGIAILTVLGVGIYGYIQTTKEEIINDAVEEQQIRAEEEKLGITRDNNLQNSQALENLERQKKAVRNSILDYVQEKTNYYYQGLGGISNATVTVYNNMNFPIEEVVVRVSYIKTNGAVWTTADVTVSNIAAKGSGVEHAPDSNRGTEVKSEIISIKSSGLDLCYYGTQPGEDPYRCR